MLPGPYVQVFSSVSGARAVLSEVNMVSVQPGRVGDVLLSPHTGFPVFASYDYTCNCASKFSLYLHM